MRLLTAVSGVRVPQQAPFERNRKSGFFLFLKSFSNPLTLFSPCTTFACRSDGENSLFRHFVPYGGSSPSTGARKAPHSEVFFRCPVLGQEPRAQCALSAKPKRHCGHRIGRDRRNAQRSLFRHSVPYGGSSPSTGTRKTPRYEVFFHHSVLGQEPARSARFRQGRNVTADTALDAIGALMRDDS